MDFKKCVSERRSVRSFEQKPVDRQTVEEIVKMAAFAPSWKNSQTASYTVLDDRAKIDKVANECTMGFDHNRNILMQTQCLVIVTTTNGISGYQPDASAMTTKGSHWQSFDAGIATQTLCLAAHEQGIGSVILGIFDEKKVIECIGIDGSKSVSALVAMGHPAEQPDMKPRKSIEELLTFG